MRAYKRLGKEGFTLVELMIVVAIIGVLAALAIYGVNKYLASAKTSEAKNTVGAISRGAQASFERETAKSEIVLPGASSVAVNHATCNTGALFTSVPGAVPVAVKYNPSQADGTDFESGDSISGWKCLKFSMSSPIYYQYTYHGNTGYVNPAGAPAISGQGFEAYAQGDLDGDGKFATFVRGGIVDTTTGSLNLTTQLYIDNEFE